MGFAVSGIAGDGYEFEFFQHLEYVGNIVVNKTPSHADAQAFGKVVEAAKSLTASKPLEPSDAGGFWGAIKEGLQRTMPSIISAGRNIVAAIAGPSPLSILKAAGSANLALMNFEDRSRYNQRTIMTNQPYEGPFAMLGM
jgi:hypothetical protein